jgi:hypothetical protein
MLLLLLLPVAVLLVRRTSLNRQRNKDSKTKKVSLALQAIEVMGDNFCNYASLYLQEGHSTNPLFQWY